MKIEQSSPLSQRLFIFKLSGNMLVITVNGHTPALYDIPCTGRVPSANWFSQEYVSLKFGINEVKQLNIVLYSTKYYNMVAAVTIPY